MHHFMKLFVFIVLTSSQLEAEPFIVIYFKMDIVMTYEHVLKHYL